MSGEQEDELLAGSPEDPAEPWQLEAPAGAAPARIDRFLAEALGLPRSRLQRWLEAGLVMVDGVAVNKPSVPVLPGQRLVVTPPAAAAQRIEPEAGPLEILYEDDDLVAIDKPAGLAVHPGAGRASGTLAHFLLHRYPEIAGVGGDGRPGIVHRLDMDTTGVMLVARSDFAYGALQRLFAERGLDKTYLALVHGEPKESAGRIDLPIGRHEGERQKMAIRESGRPAATRWQKVAGRRHFSLLRLELETGRTHQIRVHAKAIGHPLLGDPVYGENRRGAPPKVQRAIDTFPRPALHARRLAFDHPRSGQRLVLEAPVPADLLDLWARLCGEPWPQAGSSDARSV
jgi:23S rRNA pseudouridine1911/1915/1917 synthase